MKTLSIRARLTLWYTAILAVALVAFGITTWVAMRHSLLEAVDEDLQDRMMSLDAFIAQTESMEEMQHEFEENSALGPGGELFQVVDPSGRWLYRSPVLEAGGVDVPRHSGPGGAFEEAEVRGRRLRLLSRQLEARGMKYAVQIAVPVDEVYEALSIFRWILIALVPPMLALAAAGGVWISRRGLRPVTEVVRAAESIDADNLSQRLAVTRTGDEVQALAETLNKMLDRLQESFQRMVRFTGDASHELRTPVALIRAASEVALRKVRTVEEYQETLRDIGAETERVTVLIGDLLTLARADAGLGLAEQKELDLGAVAGESVHHMRALADARGIQLRLEPARDPVPVRGDRAALQRLFCILLDNAIKYTAPGGDVAVYVSAEEGSGVVEVCDRGAGISPQDLPQIFERFYRADKARSRDSGGAGLGLSIARWIVNAHEGRINVTSKLGEGSTFRVELAGVRGIAFSEDSE